jgi:hypothetical protein
LWLVTRGAQPVGSERRPLAVAAAPVWGLGKVIALEFPEWQCVRVDLDPVGAASGAGDAQSLLEELVAGDREPQLAFRGGQRYAARLVRYNPASSAAASTVGEMPVGNRQSDRQPVSFRPDASYLITGGLTGLGLRAAQWMAERGARHLVLVGRRGASAQAEAVLAAMRQGGVNVVTARADVAKQEELGKVFAEIAAAMPPLRGVLHAAGVLDDGTLLEQTWDRFAQVLSPKVTGAWNLHLSSKDLPLDFFVLFSSAAALFGSPGQGNYAAANAFLDALAHHRRALALPALSIDWGAWSEIGMAAERNVEQYFAQQGIGAIAPAQALQMLQRLLQEAPAQVGVVPVNWSRLMQHLGASGNAPFFSELASGPARREPEGPAGEGATEFRRQLDQAPPRKRGQMLLEYVRSQVAGVLALKSSQTVPDKRPLLEMGFDSLMAVELRNRLRAALAPQRPLPATLVYDYPTVAALADYLGRELFAAENAPDSPPPPQPDNSHKPDLLDQVESLSDEEVDRRLARRIEERN